MDVDRVLFTVLLYFYFLLRYAISKNPRRRETVLLITCYIIFLLNETWSRCLLYSSLGCPVHFVV